MRRTVIKSRKHGLSKISFKTLNFPRGCNGGGETTPTVDDFDVYMVTTALMIILLSVIHVDTEYTCYMVAITSI